MHKFSTAATKSSALPVLRSVGLLNVPYSTFAGASVARLVRSALSSLRDKNLCIIRARAAQAGWLFPGVVGLLLSLWVCPHLHGQTPPGGKQEGLEQQRSEEGLDYFEKWLREDAVYIITAEERTVFESLTTEEERERFIEQFWYRRDLDPRTAHNDFKEEHYRRIAYANERFSAGWPGWRTDRGRIYIIHGPPDEIEESPSGGAYERRLHEGGGRTSTYPFERWRYRHIEGMGSNIDLEFVDRDFSGVYRLALSPEEKDAFLFVPGAGYTLAEELGLSERKRRPYFAPGATYPMMNYRAQDSPFARYQTLVDVQRPRQIKYRDLQEVVDLKITYDDLPFTTQKDYLRLDDEKILVPITLEVRHKDLTFEQSNGFHQAKLALYGVVTSINRRLITEFEDEVIVSFRSEERDQGMRQGPLYRKLLLLDRNTRYRLDWVVKDLKSGRVGAKSEGIIPPAFSKGQLSASSLILSGFIVPVQESDQQMFVLGDVRVRPNLDKSFSPDDYFALYLQLYNVAIDQSTLNPSFRIYYRILQAGETMVESLDEVGESVQYISPQRVVLIKRLPLNSLAPGRYTVEVEFRDRIRNEVATVSDQFKVVSPD